MRDGKHEAAARESADSCNRARGTKHGTREKQSEKYEGGRTETRSGLFDELTVPNDDARRKCNTRQQGHRGHYFDDYPRLRPTN